MTGHLTYDAHLMYRFEKDGRAVEHDAIRDDVSLLRQLDGRCPA